jgi:hypothetical protein
MQTKELTMIDTVTLMNLLLVVRVANTIIAKKKSVLKIFLICFLGAECARLHSEANVILKVQEQLNVNRIHRVSFNFCLFF